MSSEKGIKQQKVKKYNIDIHKTVRVPYQDLREFFRLYFLFLTPFHGFSTQELLVAAELYYKRHELSKVVTDSALIDKIILSSESKQEISNNVGDIGLNRLNVILSKFIKGGLIDNGRLNPKFSPFVGEDDSTFNIVLFFQKGESDPTLQEKLVAIRRPRPDKLKKNGSSKRGNKEDTEREE